MEKKEHFEVILEDINSKLDLVFENFQNLGGKIDQNKIDSDNRNDETNKLLKFVYDDLDKKIQGNGLKIEENSNLIKENRGLIKENRTLIKENSKKIENNGTKIEENKKLIKENRKLIEENGKKIETLREKKHNYEERLILLEKRCC
jgi:chromosome segregation ATPase